MGARTPAKRRKLPQAHEVAGEWAADAKRQTGKKAAMRKTLLDALRLNARSLRDNRATLDNLICRAVERGIPQTAVAEAAGVSQAHVSRTLAANRKANEARKAARRSKKVERDGTV